MASHNIVAEPRVDYQVILDMVSEGSRVLDVGCGDGTLLELLETQKNVDGRGIELSQSGVNLCVAKGLSVIQGNADTDLSDYPDKAFDYIVLSQALQAMQAPRHVMEELIRIGKKVIVSFPNFGHWRVRLRFMFGGRMPVTKNLPYSWYDTPNIHFCTIHDFVALCHTLDARIEKATALNASGRPIPFNAPWQVWNFAGQQGIFLLSKKTHQ
jgi:methionine biosynthesis protein MetW